MLSLSNNEKIADRDQIIAKLAEQDIAARKYFYPLTNEFSCYKNTSCVDDEKTEVAKYISERIMTLPLYADLSLDDVQRICKIILN